MRKYDWRWNPALWAFALGAACSGVETAEEGKVDEGPEVGRAQQGLVDLQRDPIVLLKKAGTNECLAPVNNTLGGTLVYEPCTNVTSYFPDYNQMWRVSQLATGEQQIQNYDSGLCIRAPYGGSIKLDTCDGTSDQRWSLPHVGPPPHWTITMRSVGRGTFLAEPVWTSPVLLREVIQDSGSVGTEMIFQVTQVGVGSTRWMSLQNTQNTGCMAVPGSNLNNGTAVDGSRPCNGGDNQRWKISMYLGDLRIKPKHSSKCLETQPAGTGIQPVVQNSCNSANPEQHFALRYVSHRVYDIRTLDGRCVGTDSAGAWGTDLISGSCDAGVWSGWEAAPPAPLEAPVLSSPASGETVPTMPPFKWQAVANQQAYYLFCVAKPGVSCPTTEVPEGQDPDVLVRRVIGTEFVSYPEWKILGGFGGKPFVDLFQFDGQTVNWSVAACDELEGASSCRYQTQVRSLNVQSQWSVTAKLTGVDVHNNCDGLSDGEWRMPLTVSDGSMAAARVWSHNDVPENTLVTSFLPAPYGLVVNPSADLTFTSSGVDCDSNGIWSVVALLAVLSGDQDVWDMLTDLIDTGVDIGLTELQSCGGEEPWEFSGSNDEIGAAQVTLTPGEWLHGEMLPRSNEVDIELKADPADCGNDSAYTAFVNVTAGRL